MDFSTDYKCKLEPDEYKAIIRNLKKGQHFESFAEENYTGIKCNGKLAFIRFKPWHDEFQIPNNLNPSETFYQTSDIPQEYTEVPKPVKELHFSTPAELQEFLNNVTKFQKGELTD